MGDPVKRPSQKKRNTKLNKKIDIQNLVKKELKKMQYNKDGFKVKEQISEQTELIPYNPKVSDLKNKNLSSIKSKAEYKPEIKRTDHAMRLESVQHQLEEILKVEKQLVEAGVAQEKRKQEELVEEERIKKFHDEAAATYEAKAQERAQELEKKKVKEEEIKLANTDIIVKYTQEFQEKLSKKGIPFEYQLRIGEVYRSGLKAEQQKKEKKYRESKVKNRLEQERLKPIHEKLSKEIEDSKALVVGYELQIKQLREEIDNIKKNDILRIAVNEQSSFNTYCNSIETINTTINQLNRELMKCNYEISRSKILEELELPKKSSPSKNHVTKKFQLEAHSTQLMEGLVKAQQVKKDIQESYSEFIKLNNIQISGFDKQQDRLESLNKDISVVQKELETKELEFKKVKKTWKDLEEQVLADDKDNCEEWVEDLKKNKELIDLQIVSSYIKKDAYLKGYTPANTFVGKVGECFKLVLPSCLVWTPITKAQKVDHIGWSKMWGTNNFDKAHWSAWWAMNKNDRSSLNIHHDLDLGKINFWESKEKLDNTIKNYKQKTKYSTDIKMGVDQQSNPVVFIGGDKVTSPDKYNQLILTNHKLYKEIPDKFQSMYNNMVKKIASNNDKLTKAAEKKEKLETKNSKIYEEFEKIENAATEQKKGELSINLETEKKKIENKVNDYNQKVWRCFFPNPITKLGNENNKALKKLDKELNKKLHDKKTALDKEVSDAAKVEQEVTKNTHIQNLKVCLNALGEFKNEVNSINKSFLSANAIKNVEELEKTVNDLIKAHPAARLWNRDLDDEVNQINSELTSLQEQIKSFSEELLETGDEHIVNLLVDSFQYGAELDNHINLYEEMEAMGTSSLSVNTKVAE